jgi:pimeloyl-ACP methyl ester carboxylesterase
MEEIMINFLKLWIVTSLVLLAGCQAHQSGTMGSPVIRQAEVNNVKLTYLEQGRGEPVVFVHGAMSDFRAWEPQREAFAQHYRYIALTQRYFGAAVWTDNGEKFSLATHVDDLAAFIGALNSGPVHLVGWSYGGGIALALTVQHPELVSSLFLFEPSPTTVVTDPVETKVLGEDAKAMVFPAAAACKSGNTFEAARQLFDGVSARPGAFDKLPAEKRALILENARSIPLQFGATANTPLSCAQLGQIKVPVAIVKGELTRPYFVVLADTASRCIPGSRSISIPKGGHLAPAEEPESFNKALLGFLESKGPGLVGVTLINP